MAKPKRKISHIKRVIDEDELPIIDKAQTKINQSQRVMNDQGSWNEYNNEWQRKEEPEMKNRMREKLPEIETKEVDMMNLGLDIKQLPSNSSDYSNSVQTKSRNEAAVEFEGMKSNPEMYQVRSEVQKRQSTVAKTLDMIKVLILLNFKISFVSQ